MQRGKWIFLGYISNSRLVNKLYSICSWMGNAVPDWPIREHDEYKKISYNN